MSNKLTLKNSKGKEVSLCFLDGETFFKTVEGLNEDQLVEFADNIYKSAVNVSDKVNNQYGVLSRQIKKMDKNSVIYNMALKKLEKLNDQIESWNKVFKSLEEDKEEEEFIWVKFMINYCLGYEYEEEEE